MRRRVTSVHFLPGAAAILSNVKQSGKRDGAAAGRDGLRPGLQERPWAGQTLPPLLNKQIRVQHRPCVPLGGRQKSSLCQAGWIPCHDNTRGLVLSHPDQNPASSYQCQSAIASRGTTPGLSRAHTLLCWLILRILFPGMKECITCSKGCRKYWAREALGESRKRPWIQAPALGLYPQSRLMLRA